MNRAYTKEEQRVLPPGNGWITPFKDQEDFMKKFTEASDRIRMRSDHTVGTPYEEEPMIGLGDGAVGLTYTDCPEVKFFYVDYKNIELKIVYPSEEVMNYPCVAFIGDKEYKINWKIPSIEEVKKNEGE